MLHIGARRATHCATGDDDDDDDEDDDNDGNDDDNDMVFDNIQCQKVRVMMSECIPYFGQCILLVLKSLECLSIFIIAGYILLEFT